MYTVHIYQVIQYVPYASCNLRFELLPSNMLKEQKVFVYLNLFLDSVSIKCNFHVSLVLFICFSQSES